MPRWSELYQEFSDLPLHTKIWRGTRSEPGADLLTDGVSIVKREAVERQNGDRLEKLPERDPGYSIVAAEYVEKTWSKALTAAQREVWPVWQTRDESELRLLESIPYRAYCIEQDLSAADYFDPREKHLDRTVGLDATLARLICWLTHPVALRAQQDPRHAVVWYAEDLEPVAVQMPTRIQERAAQEYARTG